MNRVIYGIGRIMTNLEILYNDASYDVIILINLYRYPLQKF